MSSGSAHIWSQEALLCHTVDALMVRYNGRLPRHLRGPYIGNRLSVVESAEVRDSIIDLVLYRGTPGPQAIVTARLVHAAFGRMVTATTGSFEVVNTGKRATGCGD